MNYNGKFKRNQHPREEANFLSKISFFYTINIFKKAFKRDLTVNDLPEPVKHCQAKKCGDHFEQFLEKQNHVNRKKHLFVVRMIFARYKWSYLLLGLADLLTALIFSVLDPYSMGKFVACFNGTQVDYEKAIFYGTLLVSTTFLTTFCYQNIVLMHYILSLQVRSSLSSLIYRKSLKMSAESFESISLGNIVTMITKDIQLVEFSGWTSIDIVVYTVKTLTICFLLYNKMGNVGLVGILFIFTVFPLQICLFRCIKKLRLTLNQKTDERLQLIQMTLSAIKIIKMLTWESVFLNRITQKRRKEVQTILFVIYKKVVLIVSGLLNTRIGFYLVVMFYSYLGNATSAELIFYVLTLYQMLKQTIGIIIPSSLGQYADITASSQRIQTLLNAETHSIHSSVNPNTEIRLENVTVKKNNMILLKNISLTIPKGLTVLTGDVGAGKSNLIKVLIRDYIPTEGILKITDQISYASQEPWLFPSTIRQNIIFGSEFNRKRYKDVIRVCDLQYDLNLLKDGDLTMVSDKGANLSRGQQARIHLARAVYKQSQVYILDDCLSSLDNQVQNFVFNEAIRKYLNGKVCVFVSQNSQHIQQSDQIVYLKDGQIETLVNPTKNQEIKENHKNTPENHSTNSNCNHEEDDETDELLPKERVYIETPKKGQVPFEIFSKYFKFGGGFLAFGIPVLFFGLSQYAENYSDKLISEWSDLQQKLLNYTISNITNTTIIQETSIKNNNTLKLYTITIIAETFLTLIKAYVLFDFCRRASLNIHTSMIKTVLNATMQFFDRNYLGNILNRFSQDLNTVDEYISHTISEGIRVCFSIIGSILLVVSVNNKFLLPITIFTILFAFLRQTYIKTGRSLKRLELAVRSPLIGYLNTTLEGLRTIRAFKAEPLLIEEFDMHLDLYNSARFCWLDAFVAYSFFASILSAFIFLTVVVGLIFFTPNATAGSAGLALSQMTTFGATIYWASLLSARIETEMTCVERTLEYTELQQEQPKKNVAFLKNFPSNGVICFKNVSLCYAGKEGALKNVSFTINSKEKIAIVGRTGAGKSSILSVLFKLYDFHGQISIDGKNLEEISQKQLRQSITIIPQTPVLFNGTIRENLDPNNHFTSEQLWSVLKQVHLDSITNLEWKIDENGTNLSAGQRQLVCLARAILNKNQIVVLDEAAANLDHNYQLLLQNVIKEHFSDCTVLIVAHRLTFIMDCDKIMVMKCGEIVEFDSPTMLLNNTNSLFKQMVKESTI